jgi:hypothetical protein
MKLINKQQISHIIVFNETEGVWSYWGYWAKLLFVPYRKHKWWEFDKETKEGFYEDGYKGVSNIFRTKERIEKSKEHFVKGNSVWTHPFIQIFCGKDLIHQEYFTTFAELEKHLEDNYKDFDIRYE